jgi:hypothetical protein
MKDGIVLHDSKGRVRVVMGVNEKDQPAIELFDEHGVNRLLIMTGNNGTPGIIFHDEKGKETFALSDFLIRMGKIGEEHIQIDRNESKTAINISGRKGKGTAFIGMIDGQPSVALSDSKNMNHVGMTADEKHAEVAIMRKDEYVWQAEGEKAKVTKLTREPWAAWRGLGGPASSAVVLFQYRNRAVGKQGEN